MEAKTQRGNQMPKFMRNNGTGEGKQQCKRSLGDVRPLNGKNVPEPSRIGSLQNYAHEQSCQEELHQER
jgi:hypothetical protein